MAETDENEVAARLRAAALSFKGPLAALLEEAADEIAKLEREAEGLWFASIHGD